MASPDGRAWRRDCQGIVRKAINAFKAGERLWEDAVDAGARAGVKLSNAYLENEILNGADLSAFKDFPDLRIHAVGKLLDKQEEALAALNAALLSLEKALAKVRDACDLAGSCGANPKVDSIPIFKALPMRVICNFFRDIHEMYALELIVKQKVVDGLSGDPGLISAASEESQRQSMSEKRKVPTRGQMEVYLTAWKLPVHIDTNRKEEMLQMLADELQGT